MFEDVAEMEKEIETFRKNMVASSELVEGISKLTAETKKQKESFSASTEELQKKLDGCIAQFKADHDSALRALGENNNIAIETLQNSLDLEQQKRVAELDKIQDEMQKNLVAATTQSDAQIKEILKLSENLTSAFHQGTEKIQNLSNEQIKKLNDDSERIISEMKSILDAQQNVFISRAQEMEATIKEYQGAAESKYAEFVKRLETTNVDQIFMEVQNLKQSIQTKFAILMGSVGITLIIAIIGIVLK